MFNYCTLFDSNYLTRGLAMYESLKAHSAPFRLFVIAFDEKCLEVLRKLSLPEVTVIPLGEFEDEKLLSVKPGRSRAEYCWTCTSSAILYAIEKFGLDNCTYLDADLYFYSSPAPLVGEMKDRSVLITGHNYTPEYDQSATSGVYCVQFVSFRRDARGLAVLKWWRDACIDWCYARFEDGKFGDQKYLDGWPERFPGVHVLQNHGGGVAPWNVQRFDVSKRSGRLTVREKTSGTVSDLVFFHFHALRLYTNGGACLHPHYDLSKSVRRLLYMPYIDHLMSLARKVNGVDPSFDPNGSSAESRDGRCALYRVAANIAKRRLYKGYNYYDGLELSGLTRYIGWHI